MLLQQSIEHMSIVYTSNTYFNNALVHVIYSVISGQYSYTIGIGLYQHVYLKHDSFAFL